MEESEENMSAEDVGNLDSPLNVKAKPKKRSLVERELETNLTARVTSPVTSEGRSTSRYGRTRRLKTEKDNLPDVMKSLVTEMSPMKPQSPVYRMHASNSPLRMSSPQKKPTEAILENQIENIYQENIALSRFSTEEVTSPSPAKKFPKVYIRKDLIQKRDAEETVMLIKNLFSPAKSAEKRARDTHLNNVLERSSERFNLSSDKSVERSSERYSKPQNGYIDNSSVVKTLDFDSKKKKKDNKETRMVLSKSDLFDLEAKCTYQVGDLAWARMGTFPFWPCIITRDPVDGVFVRKKLFGRIERDIIHVTFFGDNGRRGWIVDTMLRKYLGQLEFEATREKFSPEDKKKDPRLYAAFFVSDKKQSLWNTSVEEAEMVLREPKRLRIDIFNDMLEKSRIVKARQKSNKISRTDSDVSLSESLYDSLFSEDDGKSDGHDLSRRSRNKSLDVFEVVTACLDNMAAKSGITKIQRQSHMDRWLQKAKSKTPEKTQVPAQKFENNIKVHSAKKKKKTPCKEVLAQKPYSLRKSGIEFHNSLAFPNEPDNSTDTMNNPTKTTDNQAPFLDPGTGIGIIAKVFSLRDKIQEGNAQKDVALVRNECFSNDEQKTPSETFKEINKIKDEKSLGYYIAESEELKKTVIEDMILENQTIKVASSNDSTIHMEETKEISTDNNHENKIGDEKSDIPDTELGDKKITSIENNIQKSLQEDVIIVTNGVDSKILKDKTPIDSKLKKLDAKKDSEMVVNDDESNKTSMNINEPGGSFESVTGKKIDNVESSQKINSCAELVKFQETPMKKNYSNEGIPMIMKDKCSDLDEVKKDSMDINELSDPIEDISKKGTGEKKNCEAVAPIMLLSIMDGNKIAENDSQEDVAMIVSNEFRFSSDNPKHISQDLDDSSNSILGIDESESNLTEGSCAVPKTSNKIYTAKPTDMGDEEIYLTKSRRVYKNNDELPEGTCLEKDASFNKNLTNVESETKSLDAERKIELHEEIPHNLITHDNTNLILDNERNKSKCEQSKYADSNITKPNEAVIMDTGDENIEQKNSIHVKQKEKWKYDITENHCSKSEMPVNGEIEINNPKNVLPKLEIKHINTNLDELSVKALIQDKVQNGLSKTITSAVVLGNNIFIDDDSDDEPLPYSPLSVDLNKDENVDELNEVDSNFEDNNDSIKNIFRDLNDSVEPINNIPKAFQSKIIANDANYPSDDLNKDECFDKLNEVYSSFKENNYDSENLIGNLNDFVKPINKISEDFQSKIIRKDAKYPQVLIERMPIINDIKRDCMNAVKHPKVIIERLPEEHVKNLYCSNNVDPKLTSLKATIDKTVESIVVEENKAHTNNEGRKSYSNEVKSAEIAERTCDIVIKNNINSKGIVKPTLGDHELQFNLLSRHIDDKDLSNEDSLVTNEQIFVALNKNTISDLGINNDVILHENIVDHPRHTDSNENIVSVKPNKSCERKPNNDCTEQPILNGYDNDNQVISKDRKRPADTPQLTKEKRCYDNDVILKKYIDKETVPIHFENTTDLKSETKRKLRSMQDKKPDNSLDNPEFVKYLQLRQDSIMDDNPDLCQEEIVAYLYKTWLYEENLKTDTKNNDVLYEFNLAKGFNNETTKIRKKNLSVKRTNKINHNDIKKEGIELKELIPDKRRRAKYDKKKQDKKENQEVIITEINVENKVEDKSTIEDVIIRKVNVENIVEDKSSIDNGEFLETVHDTLSYKLKSQVDEINEVYDNGKDSSIYSKNDAQASVLHLPDSNVNRDSEQASGSQAIDISVVSKEFKPERDSEQASGSQAIDISVDSKELKRERDSVQALGSEAIDISVDSKELKPEKSNGKSEVSQTGVYKKEREDDTDNNFDTESIDSEDSEAPLINCKLRSMRKKDNKEGIIDIEVKKEIDQDVVSINSEDSESSIPKRKKSRIVDNKTEKTMTDPEFVKYLELTQDALIDENPQLTLDEIVAYLYQTWLYEENAKTDLRKSDDIESSNIVKGLDNKVEPPKKVKRNKIKSEKETADQELISKEKPKRKIGKACYNEEYSDIEEEIEYFEIFRSKRKDKYDKNIQKEISKVEKDDGDKTIEIKEDSESEKKMTEVAKDVPTAEQDRTVEVYNEAEYYFWELTQPKPNVFKGLNREKICEICEMTTNLIKCKSCNGTFHVECVKGQTEVAAEVNTPSRGRKKKKTKGTRKPKSSDDSGNADDGSEDLNASINEVTESTESHTVDAEVLEAQLAAKMKELIDKSEKDYESYSSDDGIDWSGAIPGKCEIVEVKLKPRSPQTDYSNFKCHNCQKYDTPVCFVCKSAVSKTETVVRQKCHVAHCHKYYHLECLDHWPQTQFNGGEPSRNNKKINEYFEALTCPRHVCHTCVSDDPRGCKTRFSGDKLARCTKCPATYHSFSKCLPAGTQILTASHIICPRHCDFENRQGKVPCHVNTGWCFLCALGGSLICCEYCPTSFHAECLNIKPPEDGYMCEDCETGRLPLYGEMVWVKLGHYRWWPGLILHPSEIPDNIMAVKHSPGEFVVRFFGQYDHYWVNRGRVFPFQEGDSGRISSQKSKIDAAFTLAMEHAYRACEILKTAPPNEEESLDIASSLLPPHYVKLKVNKPCGSLCGRRLEDPESSLTQCECNPLDEDPCGPYSQCLNRMLLTECGPVCRAGDRCNNRAFEKRLYPKMVPYRTPSRGWGLKTLEDIKAGQFVIEYVGELIDEEEFRRRMRRMHEIRDENFYFLTLDKERMIDAGPKGNLARFMNHCCEPNCETQKWTVLGDVRVGLFALYDIPANSEVTFNYNLECAGIDKKRCMCGAKRCSGYIGAKPKQDDQPKKNKLPKRPYNKKRKPEDTTPKPKPKRPLGRPPKPKELTEIEKDVLIIKNATTTSSSDESRSLSTDADGNTKALKRKRVSFSTDEVILCDGTEPLSAKRKKLDVDNPVGD